MSRTLTISAEGEITLDDAMLTHRGVVPGQKLRLELCPGGAVQLRQAPSGKISDAVGILKRPNQPAVTIEEINEVIAKGWAGEL